ncbi:MAG: hypothetical protein WDM89_09595 [Rhizomicrobium sp.]
MRNESEQYSPEETEQRLQKLLKGAFSGPPTQMKDIPKKFSKAQPPRAKKTNRPA